MNITTVIVCGSPASAPAWWSPDSDLTASQAAGLAAMMDDHEAEQRELEAVEDRAQRLLVGACDGCQELCTLALVEVAGEALCPGCAEASGLDYASAVEQARAPGRAPGPGWFDPEAA